MKLPEYYGGEIPWLGSQKHFWLEVSLQSCEKDLRGFSRSNCRLLAVGCFVLLFDILCWGFIQKIGLRFG